MFELFNKKCRNFCLLFLSLISVFLQAQDNNTIPDVEKVYLHTNRSTYFMGEDLWYKAYNVRASNNLLFDNSNILYVELISADSKMIARNKTNLEMGLGHGDFQLVDSVGVKPGVYQLRAYTNWNRNFGEDFVFKKEIEIIDVFENSSKSSKPHDNTKNSTPLKIAETNKKYTIKVDFFPEGGSFLENVSSIVGFKAVDVNGKPIEIKGEIYDSDNELITAFESVHDGMGKFQMLPIEGKKYYAKIKNPKGEELQVELPKILKQGYLLSFRTFKGKSIVSINTNTATLSQNPNAKLTVTFKSKGIQYLETRQTLTETTLSFELPKDKTPEGISQITLFENNKPQSERLIYLEKEQDLEVELVMDKLNYQPNEKTILNIRSKSKAGEPKSASFSLSVTDTNGVEDDNYDSNICSYFLMESDIRGKVHKPAYYFDKKNPKRLEHLDNLLLTQGWRDFVWKTLPTPKTEFKVEKGITISGRVKQLFADKPLVNNNLTLALSGKKNRNIFSAVTDSIGRFQFENLMFSGKTNMYLNTRDEKGKFRGEIVLDSIEQAPMLVSFKKEPIILQDTTNSFAENVLKKFTAFGVKPENVLKEVTVANSAKKKDDMAANYGNYGFADKSYVAEEDTHLYTTIYELIQQKIPGLISNGNSVRFTRFDEGLGPIFIIDGRRIFPYEQSSWLDVINPSDVVKIDAITGAQSTLFFGDEGKYGIIAIYTKPNTGNKSKINSFQALKKEIEGFYTARIFYSPDPEKPNPELDKNAVVRNTIYWNPYLHPDKTGNVYQDYFNSGVETKVKVNLEGMTANGIPVVKNIYYDIKK